MVLVILACSQTMLVAAQDITCDVPLETVTFNPNTIFNENEPGIIFLHRWANAIHIDTKVTTLANESAFFLEKCDKSDDDLAELERHLRSRKYIRAATVTRDITQEKINVTTWDNWSLMPTISFGRQGGESKYSIGIKERNLLGLGIDTEFESYKNSQRSGYKIKTAIPLFSRKSIYLKLRFADNDDGTQKSLYVNKYFAGFHTPTAYSIGFDKDTRHDTVYHNNDEQTIYQHNIDRKNLQYAWLRYNNEHSLLRYRIGATQDYHQFRRLQLAKNLVGKQLLPNDRKLLYPWIGLDYLEKNFKELTNIHLVTQIEDFNLGWQLSGKFGVSNGHSDHAAWALFQAQLNKGFELHNDALLLMSLRLDGDIYEKNQQRLLMTLNSEYFYRFNANWGFYLNNKNVISHNQYVDKPVTIGGNTGLRGFPLQYQHGEHSIKVTGEIRYYPQINWFKLFDVAGATFFDAGKAFGDSLIKNIEDNWLYSVGIGARLYSPHSGSNHQVIHLDLALPQSDNPTVDTLVVRVEAKQSF